MGVVSEKTNNSVDANKAIVDSISNLSATSEEVTAASESALTVSNGAVEKMNETVAMLESVFDLSKKL